MKIYVVGKEKEQIENAQICKIRKLEKIYCERK
jgi:hypothetical protein